MEDVWSLCIVCECRAKQPDDTSVGCCMRCCLTTMVKSGGGISLAFAINMGTFEVGSAPHKIFGQLHSARLQILLSVRCVVPCPLYHHQVLVLCGCLGTGCCTIKVHHRLCGTPCFAQCTGCFQKHIGMGP